MSEEAQKLTNQEKNVSWAEVSSSDEDEEKGLKAVQSPRVIRSDDYKNKRFICSMLCVLILFIGYLLLMLWLFHVNDEGSEGYHGSQEISEYPESSDSSGYHSYSIEARAMFMGHNHRIHRCDDRGFDCCYLYTEQHNYQFNPKYIVGEDEEGSNCPSLKGIVGRYNDYLELYEMNANCSEVVCCHVDNTKENKIRNHRDEVETLVIKSEVKPNNHLKSCPSISHLMYMETQHYPDPNQDLYILGGLFALLCLWGICSNSSRGSRGSRSRGRGRK
tara:strand:- start:610 stop:1434 length:825 start_codon:yes stop_codon:yes gene_type:complete